MPNSSRSLHWRRLFKTIKPGFLKRMKNPLPTRSKVNYGEYLAFQTTETVADENAYGKFGRIIVTQKKVDLDGPCPEELHCGNDLNTDFLVNSLLSSRRRACLVMWSSNCERYSFIIKCSNIVDWKILTATFQSGNSEWSTASSYALSVFESLASTRDQSILIRKGR